MSTTQQWLTSIKSAVQSPMLRNRGLQVYAEFQQTPEIMNAMHWIFSMDGLSLLMEDFVRAEILPAIKKEYRARSSRGQEYTPQYVDSRGASSYFPNTSIMEAGFAQLEQAITTWKRWNEGGSPAIGIGPGEQVLSMRLSEYMPLSGGSNTSSPINNFFYAVEFGTGIAEHVGGSQWVRLDGPTKEQDGSWWLGRHKGEGIRMLGQEGFHFLYEARNRQPRQVWIDLVRNRFPQYIKKYFEKNFGDAIKVEMR